MLSAPVIRDALKDPRLRLRELRVFLALLDLLEFVDYRPIKRLAIARETGMAETHVSGAIRRLTRAGYCVRGPKQGDPGREVWTYRIPWSRPRNLPPAA